MPWKIGGGKWIRGTIARRLHKASRAQPVPRHIPSQRVVNRPSSKRVIFKHPRGYNRPVGFYKDKSGRTRPITRPLPRTMIYAPSPQTPRPPVRHTAVHLSPVAPKTTHETLYGHAFQTGSTGTKGGCVTCANVGIRKSEAPPTVSQPLSSVVHETKIAERPKVETPPSSDLTPPPIQETYKAKLQREHHEGKPAWLFTKKEWEIMKGYEGYWMFRDYSPSQYASMSERQKKQVNARNTAEYEQNQAILKEHREAVLSAYFEGKAVPKEVLQDYTHVIDKIKEEREVETKTKTAQLERHQAAQTMSIKDFQEYWKQKEIEKMQGTYHGDQLAQGFWDHVLRKNARLYWRSVHGETKGVPRYVAARASEDKAVTTQLQSNNIASNVKYRATVHRDFTDKDGKERHQSIHFEDFNTQEEAQRYAATQEGKTGSLTTGSKYVLKTNVQQVRLVPPASLQYISKWRS